MATKEQLKQKLTELNSQFTMIQANANAIQGAIQILTQLIKEEDEAEKPEIKE